MVTIKDITQYLEKLVPLNYQESYDNCGLLTGDAKWPVQGVLVSLDCTEEVVAEAIQSKCNLIVSHHPIWFKPRKNLSGNSYVERTLIKAIKNDVALYALHTNLDNVDFGVNQKLSDKLGLTNTSILAPKAHTLMKLVTFTPATHTHEVLEALHNAGAGAIGNYEQCSFVGQGTGSFKPTEGARPFLGQANTLEKVQEGRIEVIFPVQLKTGIIQTLKQAHPYEEVAYYLQELANKDHRLGSGMIGYLKKPLSPQEFLQHLKDSMGTPFIKHSDTASDQVHKVAVCGGSGSFLIKQAMNTSCDALVTSDIKYHEYFDADCQLLLADIGHYESEVSTKELLSDILTKKFSTFAVRLSKAETNPIRYF